MESTENSSQSLFREQLDFLDSMKFETSFSRVSRKRKENPIQIKYEENTSKSNLLEKSFPIKTEVTKNNSKHFPEIYDKIKEMRKDRNAAVDKYGCCCNHDTEAPKDVQDFQILVSLLISVQNRDESTAKAMERLRNFGLDAETIHKTDEEKILEILGGVNFNKTKAKNIKAAAKLIVKKYKNKVPNDWKLLLEFPGVGNKIAIIFLNKAKNMNIGIGVDTHVHRVCNRIGLVNNTKTPDHTRIELESFVPREEWTLINNWFVGFGQQICLPINPKCGGCLLNDICNEGRNRVIKVKEENKSEKESNEIQTKIEEIKVKEEEMDVNYTKQIKMNHDGFEVKEEAIEINLKKEENVDYNDMTNEVVKIEEEDLVIKKKVLINTKKSI